MRRSNTGHHRPRESHAWLQQEGGFALQRMHKQEEIPPVPGKRERSQDSLFSGSPFCVLDFHFLEKSLVLPCLEKTHSTKLCCFGFLKLAGEISMALQLQKAPSPRVAMRRRQDGHQGGRQAESSAPWGQPCWVWRPRQGVGKANAATVACALRDQPVAPHLPGQSPPEKVSMRQGLRKEGSIPQKSSLGALTLPARGAARAGRQAQPCHRPGAWRGGRGAAQSLQRPSQCCCLQVGAERVLAPGPANVVAWSSPSLLLWLLLKEVNLSLPPWKQTESENLPAFPDPPAFLLSGISLSNFPALWTASLSVRQDQACPD